MPRTLDRLKPIVLSRIKTPGMYADGGGLYLHVTKTGRSWIFRYRFGGRKTPRDMGLGPLHTVSLAEAREIARAARRQLLDGIDPIDTKRAARAAARLTSTEVVTFKQAAERHIAAHKPSWKSAVHAQQWANTLRDYVYPTLGAIAVQAVDTALVLKVLEPIWTKLPETAGRIRGRIEVILDACTARGERKGPNPARWKGHLANLLPKQEKVRRVRHHPALPYSELARFVQQLRSERGTASRALEFTILTAARTSEVTGARWPEIDFGAKVWTIPAERMKGHRDHRRDHRVPLSDRALEILQTRKTECDQIGETEFVFVGDRAGAGLSNNAMLALLDRMGRGDITVHGFRSTFRDWAAETTAYPREVAEMALAHTIADKVEAAYRRGDLFQKRRRMMADWAAWCARPEEHKGEVVAIRSA